MALLQNPQHSGMESPLPRRQLLGQPLHVDVQKTGNLFFAVRQSFPRQHLLHNPLVRPAGDLQPLQPLGNSVQLRHRVAQGRLSRLPRMQDRPVDVPEQ